MPGYCGIYWLRSGTVVRESQNNLHRTTWFDLLQRVALLASVAYIGTYLTIALSRMNYPFELEWMEGGVVDHVARVLHGLPLYVKPSIEFTPFIYTPLYYFVSACIAELTGLGFFPLRLVSFSASLGSFALIYLFVKRGTGSWRFGLIAAGLFAATFSLCGAWFDLARPDSLLVFLVALAAYWLRFGETRRHLLLSAVALWLAFLTKQTALIIGIPLGLYALYAFRVRALYWLVPFTVLLGTSIWILNLHYEGWFLYYVFEIPARHKIDTTQYLWFWIDSILKHVAILFLLSLMTVIVLWRAGERSRSVFLFCLLLGGLAFSWSGLLHTGGYNNVLIPTMLALVSAAATLLGPSMWLLPSSQTTSWRRHLPAGVMVLLLVQFGLLWYNPVDQIPTQQARESGRQIISALRGIQGEVYMPYHGYLPTLAGKGSFAHQMALKDVARADSSAARTMAQELDAAFGARRFGAVIFDVPRSLPVLLNNYSAAADPLSSSRPYQPVTGASMLPQYWYLAKK
jgi:hypothetical protein